MRRFRRKPTPPDLLDPGPLALRARNVRFDIEDAPLHWIPGEPVASHLVSSFNFIFPEAERFFIDAFTEALSHIRDERIREDVLGFIGQETLHADTHQMTMGAFFARHGIDTTPLERQNEWLFRRLLGPRAVADEREARQWLVERLSFIAACENFTAFLGDFALNNTWADHGAHRDMAQMWRWHGAEEMEHRTVAHDVAHYFDPSYRRRVRTMLIAVPGLLFLFARAARFLVAHDPAVPAHRFAVLRGFFSAGRRGLLPTPRMILASIRDYLRPSYSPVKMGSMAQALTFLAEVEVTNAA
ncbi:metal-dependent hydrolase [Nocardia stercoris]|uniref:Metal-dependent hydrolase n=1 Tax=Nocardia stercoris TaxID=2483361 RepID=A0A3M2KZU6_9NOCA|nr:metal-dependent hydrolase [Nocardia stercoris]RMI30186.1 metal-dependent hydrolase [Nocardia stercoris]